MTKDELVRRIERRRIRLNKLNKSFRRAKRQGLDEEKLGVKLRHLQSVRRAQKRDLFALSVLNKNASKKEGRLKEAAKISNESFNTKNLLLSVKGLDLPIGKPSNKPFTLKLGNVAISVDARLAPVASEMAKVKPFRKLLKNFGTTINKMLGELKRGLKAGNWESALSFKRKADKVKDLAAKKFISEGKRLRQAEVKNGNFENGQLLLKLASAGGILAAAAMTPGLQLIAEEVGKEGRGGFEGRNNRNEDEYNPALDAAKKTAFDGAEDGDVENEVNERVRGQ